MSKPNTKVVDVKGFRVSSHAQNRIVEQNRNLKKYYLINNLYKKPLATSKVTKDKFGKNSYRRFGNYATTIIDPDDNTICTIWRNKEKEVKNYGILRKGKKYVKKSK